MKHFLHFRDTKLLFAAFLLSVLMPSCNLFGEDEEDDVTPALSIEFLHGEWLRTGGNNSTNDGMEIMVTNNSGVVTEPAGTGYQSGDTKWRNIELQDSGSFKYEELGSDGNYYEATIKVISEDEIEINVAAAGAGNFQRWARL